MAEEITAAGGLAEAAQVEALDEQAVERHAEHVVDSFGSIDVSFNATGADGGEQGLPLLDMSVEEFGAPIAAYTRTHFVIAEAARRMARQGSGVILTLSTPMARTATALTGSFGIASAAVENLTRQLAAELGPHGVRVLCLRPTGMPDTVHLGSHTKEIWGRAARRLGVSLDALLEGSAAGPPAADRWPSPSWRTLRRFSARTGQAA